MNSGNFDAKKAPAHPNVLAVEGKDECNFFDALLRYLGISNVQIIDMGGKEKFRYEFSFFAKNAAFDTVKRIGFVRDAEDKDALSAFQSICGILKQCNLPVPSRPKEPVEIDGKRTGVFIMPNNMTSGMLEDLCISSKKDDPVWECVEKFLACYTPKIDLAKYNPSKAKILAYLSTKIPVVSELGIAALQHVWDFDNPCFNEIKSFLKEVFL